MQLLCGLEPEIRFGGWHNLGRYEKNFPAVVQQCRDVSVSKRSGIPAGSVRFGRCDVYGELAMLRQSHLSSSGNKRVEVAIKTSLSDA